MKPLFWLGDSKKILRSFPVSARREAGSELNLIQQGKQPGDSKPMPSIGKGVEEIRIWAESGTFRVVYLARLADGVYVLHAFQKKTQQTNQRDIRLARERLDQLLQERRL